MPTIIADSKVRKVGSGYTRLLLAKDWSPDKIRVATISIVVMPSPRESHVTATTPGATVNFDLQVDWWQSVPAFNRWASVEADRTTRRVAEQALVALWRELEASKEVIWPRTIV